MAVFNVSCLNVQRDPETGCTFDCGGSNHYEACRQSFYLKQQTDIIKQESQQTSVSVTTDQKIQDLESRNIDLLKIIEQQNKQIEQIIKNSEQDSSKIGELTNFQQNLYLTNIILIAVLVIITLVFLIIKFIKHKNINRLK